ncbi:MAG: hypothetical protein DRN15_09430 [Thermoprotei archaeon]|nr:MAG: hypothetical protein DRN15_09430 [Thermoprotei archaeon]
MIIVDKHEPKRFVETLRKMGVKVEVKSLPLGDYIVKDYVVERKTLDDLINSIQTARIWKQLYRLMLLQKEGYRPMIVVTGNTPYLGKGGYDSKMRQFFIFQLVSSFSYGIPVVHLDFDGRMPWFLYQLHIRSDKKKASKPVTVKKKTDIREIKSDMLSCIPGIGRTLADELSKRYSIAELSKMKEEKLSNILIGKRRLGRKGKMIKRVLNE